MDAGNLDMDSPLSINAGDRHVLPEPDFRKA